ncbi:NUDIX hydrolase [Allohahella marinimesophila]|uniref:Phosphatase NudJ n=1 Tax=Allohahella marinimesophila TaxID=1054972 RepID=A0ABP7NQ99_9GAMM
MDHESQSASVDDRWYPHATVACIVPRCRKGMAVDPFAGTLGADDMAALEFLMVEEGIEGRSVFNQPAGHVEYGETIEAAAIRETLEETGWQVRLNSFLGIYVLRIPDNSGQDRVYHRYCFLAEPLAQITNDLDDAIIRALWLDHAALAASSDRHRSPLIMACINDYLAGRRYPLALIQEYSTGDRP